jgi:hypothetical protein
MVLLLCYACNVVIFQNTKTKNHLEDNRKACRQDSVLIIVYCVLIEGHVYARWNDF